MPYAFRLIIVVVFLFPLVLSLAAPAWARITAVVIDHVESPTFEGHSFGEVGQYEKNCWPDVRRG